MKTDQDAINEATDAAMNAMALSIQNYIGSEDGGIAGMFFPGPFEDVMRRTATELLAFERIHAPAPKSPYENESEF